MLRTARSLVVVAMVGACGGATPALRQAAARSRGAASDAARKVPARGSSERTAARAPIGAANADQVQLRWEVAAGGRGRAVAIDLAGGRVAYGNEQQVRLFRLRDGSPLRSLRPCPKTGVLRGGLAFRERELIVACPGRVRLYAPGRKGARELDVAASPITAVHLRPPWVAAGHHDGVVRVYSLTDGERREIPVPGPPIDVKSLALAPDGKRVAVAWVQGSIWWWQLSRPEEPQELVRHSHEADALAYSRDGSRLAEEGAWHETQVWDPAAHRVTARLRNGAWVKRILFTHDDRWLVRGGSDGLELAEIDGPRRVVLDNQGKVEDAALGREGRWLVAADRAGRLTAWSPGPARASTRGSRARSLGNGAPLALRAGPGGPQLGRRSEP